MQIELEDIRRLSVQPGEVLVVKLAGPQDATSLQEIANSFEERLPGVHVVATDSSVDLFTVSAVPDGAVAGT